MGEPGRRRAVARAERPGPAVGKDRGTGPGPRVPAGGSGLPAGRTISDEGPGPTETQRTCDVRSCLRRAFFTGTSSSRGARWGKGGHGGKATYEGGSEYRGRPCGDGASCPRPPVLQVPRTPAVHPPPPPPPP